MRNYILPLISTLALAACQSSDTATEAVPAAVVVGFDQEFSLYYRQQAKLPVTNSAELTVSVAELQYSFCPPNARCFVADFVAPTLSITDQRGQTQQVKMPVSQARTRAANWIDTTSVRANNRRYVLYYHRYIVAENVTQPQKKDLSVVLRITKP
ncbi:hypothetical protein [Hymenobacter glacieicola]|uniref:Lipoprotein n=1 Tax=Hymenobacter glacieicola TaxID=1562124 RepID=A0ABQ1X4K4_9BACT|nr:hypothetical protein [Hymenobacter glacieicola]GGG57142.1 hypothetical protein GCM10011378_36570 [Hymenobacter glacieicola]